MSIPTHRANAVQVEQTAPLEYTVTIGFADRATLKVILGSAQARNLWIELTGAMPEQKALGLRADAAPEPGWPAPPHHKKD